MLAFLFIFISPFSFAVNNSGEPVWDTTGTEKSIQTAQTLRSLKKQEDCDTVASADSVTAIADALEVADLRRKRSFLCAVKDQIQIQNNEVVEDREFMLNYIKKSRDNPESLSNQEHIRMTERMIKYRLLRDKNGREYYVPATRYTPPPAVKRQIRELAREYIRANGAPTECTFSRADSIQKDSLTNSNCEQEIINKAQTIPHQLVLAQSALESGWGTSRLAERESNILGLQVRFSQPETMDEYPNCRPAQQDNSRCILKFNNYGGSIYEYFSRFNSSLLAGYQNYRTSRLNLYNSGSSRDECKQSYELSESINFYAENQNYINEIKEVLQLICPMSAQCGRGGGSSIAKGKGNFLQNTKEKIEEALKSNFSERFFNTRKKKKKIRNPA